MIPPVIEDSRRGERAYELYSRLLRDCLSLLWTPVDDETARVIIAQLLFLGVEDPERDVHLYVNSAGGDANTGLGIYDAMQYVAPDLETIRIGQAAGLAEILLLAGAPGKHFALRNVRVMIHQPVGQTQGLAPDIQIHAEETLRIRHQLDEILAHHSGQGPADVEANTQSDYFMSQKEALDCGMIDRIMEREPRMGRIVDPIRRSHAEEGTREGARGSRPVGKTRMEKPRADT